jgi:hypothetical protein
MCLTPKPHPAPGRSKCRQRNLDWDEPVGRQRIAFGGLRFHRIGDLAEVGEDES